MPELTWPSHFSTTSHLLVSVLSRQVVPAALIASAVQSAPVPGQTSSLSQGSLGLAARQTVLELLKVLIGHAAPVPGQYSDDCAEWQWWFCLVRFEGAG